MKTLMVAHRGAQNIAPENTLSAFHMAIENGYQAIECDVQLTKDGRLVVIHDETVDRTTDGKGWVSSLSFKDIRSLKIGEGERIPCIEEAVELVVVFSKRKLIIEIKADTEHHAKKVALTLAHYVGSLENDYQRLIEVHSFWYDALKLFKAACPDILTCAIINGGFGSGKIKDIARSTNSDGVSLGYEFISKDIVSDCHKAKLFVDTWAVSDGTVLKRLRRMSLDAIVENFTGVRST